MALSKIQAESMNLADTYAFTGTVTGAGEGVGIVEAWVNFDGTGTVAIRDSGNVSSITDNGTGIYTVNFTTNLANANYSAIANPGLTTNVNVNAGATVHVLAVGSFIIRIRNQAGAVMYDAPVVTGAVIM